MADLDTARAGTLTADTPNGPFTAIYRNDGAVLASGWTDDPHYLLPLIHPTLRPGDLDHAVDKHDRRLRKAVEAYYEGEPTAVDDVLVVQSGGPFLEQAWKALRTVGAGQTRTYTEFAELAGNGQAVRAAAAACARNAAALFVPCHRILRSDGSLGGFRYGLETKRWLLDHEAR
ncbi:methylated-DNA--[protein]-cysteine S-methyltransferase [Gordonia sp. (in: high G+C Gram-positive bacteria)]|uniref:methylated-DNA--[protein]-cysteine S-methyltransferase n=1 Tax=Gordonia sp. (in: high G+C Gram-positive bacteria) TaxID=84139 RepID=UPI0039E4B909